MFYSQLLLAKKGPLSKVWLAAHWEKKLNKQTILTTDIKATVGERRRGGLRRGEREGGWGRRGRARAPRRGEGGGEARAERARAHGAAQLRAPPPRPPLRRRATNPARRAAPPPVPACPQSKSRSP